MSKFLVYKSSHCIVTIAYVSDDRGHTIHVPPATSTLASIQNGAKCFRFLINMNGMSSATMISM